MVNVTYKKNGFNINAVWFCGDINQVLENSAADIIFFHGIDDPGLKGSITIPQKTMMTDLRRPLDELFGCLSSSCKNRIHKAERENLVFEVFTAAELKKDPNLMESFKRDFAEFIRLKGINSAFNEKAIRQYIDSGALVLTKVSKGNVCYAQHTFISDGRQTRGLYSVSNFRTEGLDTKISANANRYLHWKEIEYLRRHGFETYDWGGIRDDRKPSGVDAFKMEFRGQICTQFNVLSGKTARGKAAIFLLKRFDGILYER